MSLEQFIEAAENRTVSLVVVNRESPQAVQSMLEDLFDAQPIAIQEHQIPDDDQDKVYLIDDGEVVACSPLARLQESILLVNSDLYTTGARDATEVDPPNVIKDLENIPFRLRGYPESNKEKLLLITITRYIERLALESEGGTHHALFQRLSRIKDEQGTRDVYEQLADSPVDTHLYGIPDWTPPIEFDITIHGRWSEVVRWSWVVTFVPETERGDHGALVAIETTSRLWKGFWTYDPEKVKDITRYIKQEL